MHTSVRTGKGDMVGDIVMYVSRKPEKPGWERRERE